jgi:hypothetical protein
MIAVLLLFAGCAAPLTNTQKLEIIEDVVKSLTLKPDFRPADTLECFIVDDGVEVYNEDGDFVNELSMDQYEKLIESNKKVTKEFFGKKLKDDGYDLIEIIYDNNDFRIVLWDADGDKTCDLGTILMKIKSQSGAESWIINGATFCKDAMELAFRLKEKDADVHEYNKNAPKIAPPEDGEKERKKRMMQKGQAI